MAYPALQQVEQLAFLEKSVSSLLVSRPLMDENGGYPLPVEQVKVKMRAVATRLSKAPINYTLECLSCLFFQRLSLCMVSSWPLSFRNIVTHVQVGNCCSEEKTHFFE